MAPLFGYTGTISFSCTGLPASVGCVFSPATIAADGSNTSSLVGLSVTTVQPGVLAEAQPAGSPGNSRLAPLTFAGLPGLLLMGGLLAGRRRLGWTGKTSALMLGALLAVVSMGLGLTGCGIRSTTGTAKGTYTVMVVATGTPATGTTTQVTQQFPVTVTVQ